MYITNKEIITSNSTDEYCEILKKLKYNSSLTPNFDMTKSYGKT